MNTHLTRPALTFALITSLFLGSKAMGADIPLSQLVKGTPIKTQVGIVQFGGSEALRVTEEPDYPPEAEDRLVVIPAKLGNGIIELEMAGQPAPDAISGARGFVGVAFHVQEQAKRFEAIYLRPTNGRADNQARRNHSTQYISFPGFPWYKLRKESPAMYESYVDLVPGEWTKVKVVIQGQRAELYVHDSKQPTLIINDLKQNDRDGSVGLWIGPGTVAHFRNVKVSPL